MHVKGKGNDMYCNNNPRCKEYSTWERRWEERVMGQEAETQKAWKRKQMSHKKPALYYLLSAIVWCIVSSHPRMYFDFLKLNWVSSTTTIFSPLQHHYPGPSKLDPNPPPSQAAHPSIQNLLSEHRQQDNLCAIYPAFHSIIRIPCEYFSIHRCIFEKRRSKGDVQEEDDDSSRRIFRPSN